MIRTNIKERLDNLFKFSVICVAIVFIINLLPFHLQIEEEISLEPNITNAVTCVSRTPLLGPEGRANPVNWEEYDGEHCPGGYTNVETLDQFEERARADDAAGVCSWYNLNDCFEEFLNRVIVTVGAIPALIGAWSLTLAGDLFNFLIVNTIIDFKTAVVDQIGDGINIAWSAFRDIANIVIIGMFIFIAISLILGIKEYGEKKMIARVLVIAVLINFSLLFTKIIIDASHYVAYQFYTAAENLPKEGASSEIAVGETGDSGGIAGAFLKTMGITSAADAGNAVNDLQHSPGGSWWITLLFGFFTGGLFLITGAVLLYGSFLLTARALLLLFLMITAPLAFASWLVPKFSSQGWATWWNTLLKNAVFAPLLMVFLWASLMIANRLQTNEGTLGSLVRSAREGADLNFGMEALFSYIMILGMLFISIRFASKFSSTIAGFSTAIGFAVAPLTLGSRIAAPFLRQTLGRYGYAEQKFWGRHAGEARDSAADLRAQEEVARRSGRTWEARRLATKAGQFEAAAERNLKRAEQGGKLAGSRMNLMDTTAAKAITKGLGITGFGAGVSDKSVKSIADQIKTRAETAEKLAAKVAPSAEDLDRVKSAREREIREQRQIQKEQLQITREAAKASEEAAKQTEQLPQKLETALQHAKIEENDASQQKVTIQQNNLLSEQERTRQLRAQDDRIKRANETVKTIRDRIDIVEKPRKDTETALKNWETETKTAIEKAQKDIVIAMGKSATNIAERVGRNQGNLPTRVLGAVTGENRRVGKETKDIFKKKVGTARLRRVFESMKEDDAGAGTTNTPEQPSNH